MPSSQPINMKRNNILAVLHRLQKKCLVVYNLLCHARHNEMNRPPDCKPSLTKIIHPIPLKKSIQPCLALPT